MFGTYRVKDETALATMELGLPEYRERGPSSPGRLLLLPFRNGTAGGEVRTPIAES